MPTFLELHIKKLDPDETIRDQQHYMLAKALAPLVDNEVLKVMCLLSEVSELISKCSTISDQAMCTEMLHNLILNIENYTEPTVAAMFERNLFGGTQH